MSKFVAAVIATIIASSHAHAQGPEAPSPPAALVEPDRFMLVGLGVLVGGDASLVNAGYTLEVGWRIPRMPAIVRAEGTLGASADADGKGDFRRAAVGVELRRCPSSSGCVFAGVGIGYQEQAWDSGEPGEMIERHTGALVAPRVGAEVGGRSVRLRVALEVHAYDHHDHRDGSRAWERGWAGSLSLAYRR